MHPLGNHYDPRISPVAQLKDALLRDHDLVPGRTSTHRAAMRALGSRVGLTDGTFLSNRLRHTLGADQDPADTTLPLAYGWDLTPDDQSTLLGAQVEYLQSLIDSIWG